MSYRIKLTRPLAKQRRRIAREQLDKALAELNSSSFEAQHYVHQLRRRLKKLRALIRLYRFADEAWYRQENSCFRDLAQEYAGPRNADVAVHTCEAMINQAKRPIETGAFEKILAQLKEAKNLEYTAEESSLNFEQLRDSLSEARNRVNDWPTKKLDTDLVISGFGRTYTRGRSALKRVRQNPSPEAWHELRKRVKYQRYQWKLLRELWPQLVNPRRHELHRLSDLLGEEHDLTEFVRTLERLETTEIDSKQTLIILAKQRREELHCRALPLSRKLFTDKTKCVKARLKEWFVIAAST